MAVVAKPQDIGSKPSISAEEIEKRRLMVRKAELSNRMEGLRPDPMADPIFEAFVQGRIELDEILPRLNALYKIKAK